MHEDDGECGSYWSEVDKQEKEEKLSMSKLYIQDIRNCAANSSAAGSLHQWITVSDFQRKSKTLNIFNLFFKDCWDALINNVHRLFPVENMLQG
jgi:hypothetical protein